MKLKRQYSGLRSLPFWRAVNGINKKNFAAWNCLYAFAVQLQNTEESVLRMLAELSKTDPSVTKRAAKRGAR